ncbi:cupin domain-containing protein [Bilophila wadsworthia]|uniref:(R)-mandelonitrile lyase n=1 Tax=Bilophila wadsworthia TaxID=35833 RepID=UPI003AAEBD18
MKRFFMITVFTLFASGMMYAGTAQSVENNTAKQIITQAGTHHSVKGSKQYFTGNVRVDRLFNAEKEAPFTASYVTFEPGARSFWHVHTAGQHLVVTYGIGRTGTADGKVEEFRAGDVLWCPPGVKHWHGAAPHTGMTHMAITGAKDGKSTEWMEEVTEEQYNAR